ncbi:conserved hypothetical protein [Theileria equi strain WA]|uniref:Uncharacterized protein n=1 Tax=Theileria equi strain WA TaxID=1537102 RepID=L1LDA4_THEEQ|nr:conserved hypothetical protein [Theileria equi strain WA]EKX73244.1 conserved hypothetical protein [Theileria equi strain WA]|eukprot:XP_004832696.1 conserved hypothetical protein [Theileria equi strain WA]
MEKKSDLLAVLALNTEKLVQDLKWHFESLDNPKSIADLDPKFNSHVKNLLEEESTPTHDHRDTHFEDDTKCPENAEFQDIAHYYTKVFDGIVDICKAKRKELEKDVVETLLKHEHELSEFSMEVSYCDGTLKVVEDSISKQYDSLEQSSKIITKLHNESKDISLRLENRKLLLERLQRFVDDVIITPNMIKAICNDPIDEKFVTVLENFRIKSNNINKIHKDYPSVVCDPNNNNYAQESSRIQLQKLELVLVRRISDFLSLEISKLSMPKVNIQLIQTTRFLSLLPLYDYLKEFKNYSSEISKMYVSTMRRTYSHLFENYLLSLEKGKGRERCRDVYSILKGLDSGNITSNKETLSRFGLSGRDSVLSTYNSQPILPTGLQNIVLKQEDIVRSFLKLFVDTATTEFAFISKFFSCSNKALNDSREPDSKVTREAYEFSTNGMFREVLVDVLDIFKGNLNHYISSTYDVVGLVMIYSLVVINRKVLKGRELTLLDPELYEIETICFQRIMYVIKDFTDFIFKFVQGSQASAVSTWMPAPFTINCAHILVSLIKMYDYVVQVSNDAVISSFYKTTLRLYKLLQNSIIESAKRLKNKEQESIIIIGNYSMLYNILFNTCAISVDNANSIFAQHIKTVEEILNENLNIYSGIIINDHFKFIIDIEVPSDDDTPKKTLSIANLAVSYRKIAEEFMDKYKAKLSKIHNRISASFTYKPIALLVTRNVLDHLKNVYSTFYSTIKSHFSDTGAEWLENMPDVSEFNYN